MSRDVTLEHVTIRFGSHTAVDDAHLTIRSGEFFSFLGPSGCGKTTLLRCVSGFLEPTEGRVLIGGEDMRGVGPNRRPTALIFQNLALFPLMSVAENIAFALEVRGVGRQARRKRAVELLELIALPHVGDKKVYELSGGQRQRVAIARALAAEPQILLLDEPLSALDLKLRQHMRSELRAIQRRVGLTFIYITHDQGEALTMSDRVAVMSEGRIEQVDEPLAVYDHPKTSFVASFVGETNVLPATVTGRDGTDVTLQTDGGLIVQGFAVGRRQYRAGERCQVFVRPEQIKVAPPEPGPNRLAARVLAEEFEGNLRHVSLAVGGSVGGSGGAPAVGALAVGGQPLRMSVVNDGSLPPLQPDAALTVTFDPSVASVLPEGPLARA
ncbi:spermidine/putrescine transport system ATP-binding protein [Tistlia consotensis]|uniref:Spermidine/putrescine transport system ATP-binding protein n=1 Tax=Tistlia consotensis USBA 355 TaxID=560819 RepID=A0A1Y6BIL4_9PROT|nr:ABC transporter ATP-binding protein [Tistlia consotensis]SMF13215.1 spermidine/putrescine transport system ATP-binding protein [Tistlia consotensis USBA 355]SNR50661.1 spermidine/putrescine transport system ATP-binding protein [Tistlia consotensis]